MGREHKFLGVDEQVMSVQKDGRLEGVSLPSEGPLHIGWLGGIGAGQGGGGGR